MQLNYYLLRIDLMLDAWNRVRQQSLPKGAYNPRNNNNNPLIIQAQNAPGDHAIGPYRSATQRMFSLLVMYHSTSTAQS